MKLTTRQLSQNLQSKQALPPVVWISGEEPLLVIEACDAVRHEAVSRGITARNVIEVDARFDGSDLIAANQSLSLFGDREVIELRLHSKLSDAARKALLEYVEHANPDNLLLIISDRIEGTQTKAKWFNKIIELAWWVPIWPIEHNQLGSWIKERARQAGLTIEADALALLTDRMDGNLLAAKQEIDKLALLIDGQHITADVVLAGVSDSSRYNVFDLSSAMLTGDLVRGMKILHGLESEGIEPPIVLWLLTRELRLVIELLEAKAQQQPISAAFKRLRVFDKRQRDYQLAMERADGAHYQRCLIACAQIDAAIKGQIKDDPWSKISAVLVAISAPNLPAYSF